MKKIILTYIKWIFGWNLSLILCHLIWLIDEFGIWYVICRGHGTTSCLFHLTFNFYERCLNSFALYDRMTMVERWLLFVNDGLSYIVTQFTVFPFDYTVKIWKGFELDQNLLFQTVFFWHSRGMKVIQTNSCFEMCVPLFTFSRIACVYLIIYIYFFLHIFLQIKNIS